MQVLLNVEVTNLNLLTLHLMDEAAVSDLVVIVVSGKLTRYTLGISGQSDGIEGAVRTQLG
jgi:hypothetical protein